MAGPGIWNLRNLGLGSKTLVSKPELGVVSLMGEWFWEKSMAVSCQDLREKESLLR
jgi:hypothetical protein